MSAQAYPLQWPLGWPRTANFERKYGRFAVDGRDISLYQATRRVVEEVALFTPSGRSWRINPDDIVLSTNLEIRRADGLPKANQRIPDDPGAALYFTFDGHPRVVPCDRYTEVEQNIAAIAATLSALRTLERHGSGIMERAFTGFEALPHLAPEAWHEALMVPADAPADVVEAQYKRLRSAYHPDRPDGSAEQFHRIQQAWERFVALGEARA